MNSAPNSQIDVAEEAMRWLQAGVEKKASDWHFTPNEPIALRVYGDIEFISHPPIPEADVFRAWQIITKDETMKIADFYVPDDRSVAVTLPDGKSQRFRVHAKLSTAGFSFNLRSLADKPIPLTKLETPPQLLDLIKTRTAGLILVTGQTGSGKTTTLASIVDSLIQTRPIKVATYEAPVEVLFSSKVGLVQQHDVGKVGRGQISSFIEASKSSMREDPDVIMFGELRETEAIRYALEAAETGHLVFGTLHTGNALQSISRLIAAAPEDGKEFFLHTIATSLIGVLCQRLIPTRDKKLRANYELMIVTEGIAGCITRADFNQISNAILTGKRDGMFTFDDHLGDLVTKKEYTAEEAVSFSSTPRTTLQHLLQKKLINEAQHLALKKSYAL